MEQLATSIARFRGWLRSDMLVLRWVLLGLYLAVLLGLVVLAFMPEDMGPVLVLGAVLLGSQAFFILGAGTINLCRPIRKHRLWMPVTAAAFMLTLLMAGLWLGMSELFYLDQKMGEDYFLAVFCLAVGGGWIGWGVLLWVYARRWTRYQTLWRLSSLLFAGSLLELVASAPSHVITSRRPGCLAGIGTMLGIVAGVYVMLFSFGPMIVLLFLRPRYRRERMEDTLCPVCEYDLRGTIAAGRTQCPECGAEITKKSIIA